MIPIPATPEVDGGSGPSPPVLISSSPPVPGPINNLPSELSMLVTVRDANVSDTIYVRVFRDYDKDKMRGPVYETSATNDATTGTVDRKFELQVRNWCLDVGTQINEQLPFTAVIADRPFDPNPVADPNLPFQKVTENGQFSRVGWMGICTKERL